MVIDIIKGEWSEAAQRVLAERYLIKKDGEVIETPDEMCWRVAHTIARAEEQWAENEEEVHKVAEEFYRIMVERKFMPNSPTLMNAGKDNGLQYSACYVLPVGDSMIEIFDAIKNAAIIHQCLAEDTWIRTSVGMKQIKNLQPGDMVFDRDGIERAIINVIPTGKQEVYRFVTTKGTYGIATLGHKFLCVTNTHRNYTTRKSRLEFKELSDITNKDGLVLAKLTPTVGALQTIEFDYEYKADASLGHHVNKPVNVPTVIDEDLAWVLGFFIGDGSYHQDGLRFHLNSEESPEFKDNLIKILGRAFGDDVVTNVTEDKTGDEVSIYRAELKAFFKMLLGDDKHDIPDIIFSSPASVRWNFISGLLDADGCVRKNGYLLISTSYERLYSKLEGLFNSLGVHTGVTILREDSQYLPSYQIRPIGKLSYQACYDNLRLLHPKKRDRLRPIDIQKTGMGTLDGYDFIKLKGLQYYGDVQTYNLTVADVHEYAVSQLVSKNSGGGTGFAFSRIRPKDSLVKSSGGRASGPVSFLRAFDSTTEAVKQGGCFPGSTLIATINGAKPIAELKEGELVYSWDGRFILSACTDSWMTKRNAEVWKLKTDKGLIIYATPDHPFLARYSGPGSRKEYIKLKDLKPGTPLMPLTRYIKDGEWWITLHDGNDTRIPEHQFIAEYIGISGEHIHHIDGNHLNNSPDNLKGMSHSEHARLHGIANYESGTHPFSRLTEQQKEKGVEAWKNWYHNLTSQERDEYWNGISKAKSEWNRRRIEEGTHNFVTNPPWEDEDTKLKAKRSRIANSIWKVMLFGLPVTKESWAESLKEAGLYRTQCYTVDHIMDVFGSWDNMLEYVDQRNHRVISVEFSHYEDVYNVEVPGPHNFVVCDEEMKGVVVSNTRRGANMAVLRVDHPDIDEFITCKQNGGISNFNISVAITDEFMRAYECDEEYELVAPHTKGVTGKRPAREVFDEIARGAWTTGDPGLIFIDKINQSVANPVPELGEIEATNPCVTGDTLVAVADGRNCVPIKQLAAEGKDVPVYCYGNGRVQIRMGRNPRLTRKNVEIWKVVLDDGSEVKATSDHKFILRDGATIELRNLKEGDSLMPFYKYQYKRGIQKYWGINLNNGQFNSEHILINEFETGEIIDRIRFVVHHKNYNGLDNRVGNLELMTTAEHSTLHRLDYNNNPMQGLWWDSATEGEKNTYRENMRRACSGENNGMYGKRHSEETKKKIGLESIERSRNPEYRARISNSLKEYFKLNGTEKLKGDRVEKIEYHCANCGKNLFMSEKEYQYRIKSNKSNRVFCSGGCGISYKKGFTYWTDDEVIEWGVKFQEVYGKLPTFHKWEEFSKGRREIPSREIIRKQIGGFRKFKEVLSMYNHKVVSIEFIGYEDVYNLTVDEFHNYAIISNKNLKTRSGNVKYGGIICKNCGEQPLHPKESCNLGSINLLKFITERDGKKEIDWDELELTVRVAVRFLDDVIDMNPYPLPEVEEAATSNRRIGLGIMGWADLLFELGVPYDSEEALELAGRIMGFIREKGHDESIKLAEVRGPFTNWSRSIYKDGKPQRNASITTVAPTGTVSIISGCSSGIEPIFALAFSHISEDRHLTFVNQQFEQVAKERGFYSPKLIEEVKATGSVQNSYEIPEEMKSVFKIAHELEPEWHVRMQAAFQKHVDSSVSKTVNLHNSATVEDVKEIYLLAYELGCMGITVFRDGCRDEQVLHVGAQAEEEFEDNEPKKKRPSVLMGATYRTKTPVGTAYVTVNHDDKNDPLEVFLNIGKAGSDISAMAEALGRLISLCLRISSTLSPLEKAYEIIEELNGIGGSRTLGFGEARVLSLPDAIARVLAEHTGMKRTDNLVVRQPSPIAKATESEHYHNPLVTGDLCPDCGHATFVHEEGCYKCYSCGYSEC